MRSTMIFGSIWVLLAVLGASAGMNAWAAYLHDSSAGTQRFGKSGDFLVPSAAGWQSKELFLGRTESEDAAVVRILNCTDYVFREYSRAGVSFDIYVAHWTRG